MSQKVNLNAYFERIGFAGSIAPTLATLEMIHALHPAAIPFEDLDPVMGRPVPLDQASLEQKLLHDRRGGYCFEHNTLLMNILRDLDYQVTGHGAQVLWGHEEGEERPVSHMVLLVEISGTSYLADVGFGTFTLLAPLKLRADVEQTVRQDVFRLGKTETGFRLDVKLGEDWHGVYKFALAPLGEAETGRLNALVADEYHQRALLFASRADAEGRFNLSGNRVTIHRPDAPRERYELATPAEIKTVLSETFRIALPPDSALDPALERVFAALPPQAD